MPRLAVAAALVVLLATAGCEHAPLNEIPEPDLVDATALPPPSDRVYYLVKTQGNVVRLERGAVPVLQELLDHRFRLDSAWMPAQGTPCLSINAVAALVVQLEKPDGRIEAFGFQNDPSPYLVNCGVNVFEQYRFR